MAGNSSTVFIIFLLLLTWTSVQIASTQQSCNSTRFLSANVTEGDTGNAVVINIRQFFGYTQDYEIVKTVNGALETRVFNTHFDASTPDEIRTPNTIDRDAIANELGNTFLPVVFHLHYVVFQVQNFDNQDCINLELNVIDRDDNSPEFVGLETQMYPVTFDENDADVQSQLPLARDNDEGNNSIQNYTLVDNLGKFELDTRKGENGEIVRLVLKLQSGVVLDYENQTNYNITVIASEGNANPDTVLLQISVTVKDRCDEMPYFPLSAYHFTVRENNNIGTVVGRVSAVDSDQIDKNRLRYVINDICARETADSVCILIDDNPIVIDRETGDIILDSVLDRELNEEYIVIIQAVDGCGRSATASITVSVEGENDNIPTFVQDSINIIVCRSTQPRTVIGKVITEDRDQGYANAKTVYTADNSTHGSKFFAVLYDTGKIVVIQNLPSEEQTYTLIITACNLPSTLCTSIDVTVTVSSAKPFPCAEEEEEEEEQLETITETMQEPSTQISDKPLPANVSPNGGLSIIIATVFIVVSLVVIALTTVMVLSVLIMRYKSLSRKLEVEVDERKSSSATIASSKV